MSTNCTGNCAECVEHLREATETMTNEAEEPRRDELSTPDSLSDSLSEPLYTGNFEYLILPHASITKATLKNTEYDAMRIIYKIMAKSNSSLWPLDTAMDARYHLQPFYRGKSKAVLTDIYNEETGIDIAQKKALNKYHGAIEKKLNEFAIELVTILAHLVKYCEKKHYKLTIPTIEEIDRRNFTQPKDREL